MTKRILTFALFLYCCALWAGNGYKAEFKQRNSSQYEISFTLTDWSVKEVSLDGQTYQKIVFDESAVTNRKGWAELPFISASVQLPNEKDVNLQITDSQYVDIQLNHPLVPSRGTIYRNQNPKEIAYEIAPEAKIDRFYPEILSQMESPFIIRDVRGTTVRIYPFRYNAVAQTLRVYTSVTVVLTENDQPATNPLTRKNTNPTIGSADLYKSMFLNYKTPKGLGSATLSKMDEYGDILVVTTSDYSSTMDAYIQWKREKGYNVTKKIVAKGTNIKTTISNEYASNPKLMYVQIAGDWADIKSPTYDSAPTDPSMGCVSGNDNYPDISIGRFSCANATDLAGQIAKTIRYEKEPDMTSGWRETFIGIGSDQGGDESGDDGEIDYEHIQNIYNNKLNPFGYKTHRQNYGSNPSSSTLASHINAGASTIAYCGHGDVTYWVTTYYNNAQINKATNGEKMPFIVSVACVNGAFHESSVCFAETWLRKADGGAIVMWGSSINQPWDPPQRGQDYFYDILVGGYNYDNYPTQDGYKISEQRTHWGSIAVNSFNLMLKESSYSDDIATTKTWTTFGDGSVQLRTKTPEVLTLTNETVMMGIPFSGTATVNGQPLANVQICISQNGVYFSTLTDASGNYTINHTFTTDSVLIVATAFNTTTIYDKVVCTPSCDGVDNLSADIDNINNVTLTWEAPANGLAINYNVYCNGQLVGTTTSTTYQQFGLLNGTYEYAVTPNYKDDGECIVKASKTVTIDDGFDHDCAKVENPATKQSDDLLTLTWDEPKNGVNITDDVESHTSFGINSSGSIGWSYIDGDNHSATYGLSGYDTYTNAGAAMAYIVFDPTQIINSTDKTPLSDIIPAHSGNKFFASFSSSEGSTDDWLVSPYLFGTHAYKLEFYARGSHKSDYGYESFKVAYSTTGNSESDFSNVVGNVSSVPYTWTKYSYTIPANATYIGINCTSQDILYLCIDDISIKEENISPVTYYQVYCNNSPIGTTTSTTYKINNLATGKYEYCVEAHYANGCISLPSCITDTIVSSNYSITANASVGGIISPSGMISVVQGGNKKFTITPKGTYTIKDVFVDNKSVGAVTSYTFSKVNKNHTIYAEFEKKSTIDIPTSVTDNNIANFSFYPNPADDVLNIISEGKGELEILNFIGQVLYKKNLAEQKTEIDIKGFSSGVYFIRLKDENDETTRKFIKK